jgi:hypothetical protein
MSDALTMREARELLAEFADLSRDACDRSWRTLAAVDECGNVKCRRTGWEHLLKAAVPVSVPLSRSTTPTTEETQPRVDTMETGR